MAPAPVTPAAAPAVVPAANDGIVAAVPAATRPVSPASASPAPSSSAFSAESSWTKPIAAPAASQAAAVVVADKGPGIGIFGLFAVMGGVLLVGLGGLAFALWSRNRPGHW
ncbi:hypothetical protein [Arthrobacter sp. AFG20]|uniref:hypothetical protein n=1 Tax=Arthrobacter sp. AFG20 TaxID=1688671 RepID=UPI000C9E387E|nr:hypothetical protein [Arthrobacter sp. AFG20]PNH86593.1 hypothetical protein CXZ05_00980 [Arthrobacter sp. AFG20]